MKVPAQLHDVHGHQRELWNPHAPDNMLERYLALEAGKANPATFVEHQKRIGKLARKRRRMRLPEPTAEEWAEFRAACLAAGMEDDDG